MQATNIFRVKFSEQVLRESDVPLSLSLQRLPPPSFSHKLFPSSSLSLTLSPSPSTKSHVKQQAYNVYLECNALIFCRPHFYSFFFLFLFLYSSLLFYSSFIRALNKIFMIFCSNIEFFRLSLYKIYFFFYLECRNEKLNLQNVPPQLTHTLSHTSTHSLSHIHRHIHALTYKHTLTHTHTHTRTQTRTHSHTLVHIHSPEQFFVLQLDSKFCFFLLLTFFIKIFKW